MRQIILIICGLCAISSFGQIREVNASFNLSKVVMLDLYPNNSAVTLNLSSAIEAGEKATVVTENNNLWINFSSAVAPDAASRSISVKIDGGQVPSGIKLKLSTSTIMGIGQGDRGSPSAAILTLSGTSQPLISNIRGAYTGAGNNGYKLTYSLEIFDYALLDFNQNANLIITLTLNEFQ